MQTIVCATRGGEPSRRAQQKAITFAHERGARLIFLYVVDDTFVDDLAAPIVVDVEASMTRMGEFLLLLAQERALEQGVTAEGVVRHGKVPDVIPAFLAEVRATTLVLGRPHPRAGRPVFDQGQVDPYAERLSQETGVEVVTV